jgi:glycosyltransferase involved in cell wall biosynthesis
MNIILKGQLKFMNQYFEVVGVTGNDGKHFNEISEREGIRMFALEMKRTISPLQDLIALYKMIRFLHREKPQIVHSHTPKAGLLGMLAAKFCGIPVRLHTVAGLPLVEAHGFKRWVLALTERITYKCATAIYPNSAGLMQIIEKENLNSGVPTQVIANGSSNGIDIDHFSPESINDSAHSRNAIREELQIQPHALLFCFVGRIAKEKGIEELVEAFEGLSSQQAGLHLLLIGPLEKENGPVSELTLEKIRVHKNISAPGRVDDVRPFLNASDIFVFPSYREGFPNVLMQAGAMGLPSIASDINGCNEIIHEGQNGLLVPVKDSNKLRNAMYSLANDKGQRIRLASQARNLITSRYNSKFIWKELKEEYEFHLKKYGK